MPPATGRSRGSSRTFSKRAGSWPRNRASSPRAPRPRRSPSARPAAPGGVMQVENRVYPAPEQIAALQQPTPGDGPIVMVNLLKYRAQARYADGSEPELSGRDAYLRYAVA